MVSDLERLRDDLRAFASARDWEQFHLPKNLVLALVGEVGEVAELFQWRTSEESASGALDADARAAVEDELADVLLYLVRLADVLDVDLGAAARAKIARNVERYPAEEVRGRFPPGALGACMTRTALGSPLTGNRWCVRLVGAPPESRSPAYGRCGNVRCGCQTLDRFSAVALPCPPTSGRPRATGSRGWRPHPTKGAIDEAPDATDEAPECCQPWRPRRDCWDA